MTVFARLRRMLFSTSSSVFRLFRLGGTQINYGREVGDARGSSIASATLMWIARTFPEAPPAVWPSDAAPGQERPIANHRLVRLLERPNPYFTGPLLWMATTVDWNANGDAYWLKEFDSLGSSEPARLWWVPSWQMEPKSSDDGSVFIERYDYTVDGKTYPVPVDQVVHFRYGADPDNPRKGLSPLRAQTREIFTDDESANFTAVLLRNMGVPGIIVSPDFDTPDGGITPEEAEQVKATIRAQFTGDRRGDVAVLTGKTKVEQFGFSPEELILRELRRIPEERVTAALGIPAVVVGLGAGLERSTFTNMAEAREAAYEAGLIPMQRILAEDVRFQLLTDFVDDPHAFRFGFDLSRVRVLQEDLYRQAQRLDLGVRGGWAQVAEARFAVGLEVSDADAIYLRQTSYVEVPADGGDVRVLAPAKSSNGGPPAGIAATPGEVALEVVRAIEARERLDGAAHYARGGRK